MDSRRGGIIAELGSNEEEIITFFNGLNSEQLGMTVYPEDPAWTVQQVLAHFIKIERLEIKLTAAAGYAKHEAHGLTSCMIFSSSSS